MSVPEVEEINISCEAGMEESFPGASAPKESLIAPECQLPTFHMVEFDIWDW